MVSQGAKDEQWLLRAQKVEVQPALVPLVSECRKRFPKPENARIDGQALNSQ